MRRSAWFAAVGLLCAFLSLTALADGTFQSRSGMKYIVQNGRSAGKGMVLLLHGAGDNPENFLQFNAAMCKGLMVVAPKSTGPGWVTQDTDKLVEVLEEVTKKYPVNPDRIHVFGHSSGAQMSLTLGLTRPKWFASIGAISGGIGILESSIKPEASSIPVFLAHSRDDKVVPVSGSQRAKETLEKLGFDVTYYEKDGMGHLMDSDVRQKWAAWALGKKKLFMPGNVDALSWQSGEGTDLSSGTLAFAYLYDSKKNKDNKGCKAFELGVAVDKDVQEALESVSCFKVDVASSTTLQEKLGVKKTPTWVVFHVADDGTYEVDKEFKGKVSGRSLISTLEKARKAMGE